MEQKLHAPPKQGAVHGAIYHKLYENKKSYLTFFFHALKIKK